MKAKRTINTAMATDQASNTVSTYPTTQVRPIESEDERSEYERVIGLTCVAPHPNPATMPDPEVEARTARRRYSGDYKLKILQQVDKCSSKGELGALLRREGLYSSQLTKWRKQFKQGALCGL